MKDNVIGRLRYINSSSTPANKHCHPVGASPLEKLPAEIAHHIMDYVWTDDERCIINNTWTSGKHRLVQGSIASTSKTLNAVAQSNARSYFERVVVVLSWRLCADALERWLHAIRPDLLERITRLSVKGAWRYRDTRYADDWILTRFDATGNTYFDHALRQVNKRDGMVVLDAMSIRRIWLALYVKDFNKAGPPEWVIERPLRRLCDAALEHPFLLQAAKEIAEPAHAKIRAERNFHELMRLVDDIW